MAFLKSTYRKRSGMVSSVQLVERWSAERDIVGIDPGNQINN